MLLYIGAVVLFILLVIKPGASIIFNKKTINRYSIIPDTEIAFLYKPQVNPLFFRNQNILLFENKQPLSIAEENSVIAEGNGAFSSSEPPKGPVYIYFSSSDNTNPSTNNRPYTLYLPLKFISRSLGMLYLGLLLPGLIWFLVFAFAFPSHRKLIFQTPIGLLKVTDLFAGLALQATQAYFTRLWQRMRHRAVYWKRLLTLTVLSAFFYIFMEWLFFVTMPSFMSMMAFMNKVEIFLISDLGFSLFSLLIVIAFIFIDFLAVVAHVEKITSILGLLIPTIILSSLALLLIDNFTYTLFKFGVSTSSGVGRALYGVLFVLLTAYIYYQMMRFFSLIGLAQPSKVTLNRLVYSGSAILVISLGFALLKMDWGNISPSTISAETEQATRMPNILLLGSDGLNAENMSVYGYVRLTTPQLEELARTSLVAENAFTNAGNSAGSVISIMTSKLPTQTRLLYPPDILTGINSFQHLPGILKNLGYKTVEYGAPYYVDSYAFNLQDGFDMVNDRSVSVGKLGDLGRRLGYDDEVYFLSRLYWRLSDRIGHIFFILEMQNPFDIVTRPVPSISDQTKIDQILALFDQSTGPLFIHAHLLGTHGGFYNVDTQVFSKGESQSQPWMTDFYDDTILRFDQYVGKVIDHLKQIGQYDNTILIIYTDHGKLFKVTERIPLIIHFPGDEFAGTITSNVQNLDIAPTALDYLGLPIPQWMNGKSLLIRDGIGRRLIFSTGTTKVKPNAQDIAFLDPAQVQPPFYQFSFLDILDCQEMYSFDLTSYEWISSEVAGYVDPCNEGDLLSFDEIKQSLYQRLDMDGFDISSLP
jgi:hypothetical protein